MKIDYANDSFFQVPKMSVKTDSGKVDTPFLYYDVTNIMALFRADSDGVEKLLADTDFIPAIFVAGKPLVGLSIYEYRDSSAGSYNEVGLAMPVLMRGRGIPSNNPLSILRSLEKSEMGFYVFDLPVTTEYTSNLGQSLYGLPKFLTDIPFNLNGKYLNTEVMDPEAGKILSLRGNLNFAVRIPSLSFAVYSMLKDKTMRSIVNVRGKNRFHAAHGLRLTIGNSDHRMAKNLRTLGIDSKRPIAVTSCLDFQSRLNIGAEI